MTEQTNLGIDASFFNNYSLLFNVFSKKTTDILGRLDVPLSLGLGSGSNSKPYQNIGTMMNRGVELSLGYDNRWNNWELHAVLNGTYLENEVLDLGGLDYIAHNDVVSGYSPPSNIIRSHIGYPFGSYFGFIADGIYQVPDFIWQNDSDPAIDHYDREYMLKPEFADPTAVVRNPQTGDIKFKNISVPDGEKDGMITNDDITYMGSSQPDYLLSFSLSAHYKRLYLSMLGQGTFGSNAYIMGAMITPFWGGRGNISQEMADNRWTIENPSDQWQMLYDDSQRANLVSTYYLQNASYFRMKNIEIGYTFDKGFIDKAGIDELRLIFSIENPFTLTNLYGFDPEKPLNRITGDFHPQIRIYSFGFNLKI